MDISSEKPTPEPSDLDLLPVLTTRDQDRLHLCSLILSAADLPHIIDWNGTDGWVILSSPSHIDKATAEIAAYDHENNNWPLKPSAEEDFNPYFRVQSIFIIVSLMLFYGVTGPWTIHTLWFSYGAVDSARILNDGEYFRLMTGLTLHADLVHLLGNCFLGAFLLHFYFLLIGNGIGIFALLTTSCLANYINVLAHGPGHHSVGFSTALFAVIGMLCALNYRHYRLSRPERLLLPLMAGAAMLAMLGSGNEAGRTDLGAHLFGLLVGLGAGTFLGLEKIYSLRHNTCLQVILFVLSLTSVVICWVIALR